MLLVSTFQKRGEGHMTPNTPPPSPPTIFHVLDVRSLHNHEQMLVIFTTAVEMCCRRVEFPRKA